MSWGGLNNALTAWRNAVMRRFPNKDTESDGARADAVHGSTSQHQEDEDGTTDAYDMDVNVLDSGQQKGSVTERALIEAMKLDFEQDPHGRSLLWIHQREIANATIGAWREREYGGAAHDRHVHWESRQAREDDGREWPMPHTDRLLRELRGDDDMGMGADEFFASAARAARGDAAATAADRTNRKNAAEVLRFALGLPVEDQIAENLPCGQAGLLVQIIDRLPEGPSASSLRG
jgi:hypothetical protein